MCPKQLKFNIKNLYIQRMFPLLLALEICDVQFPVSTLNYVKVREHKYKRHQFKLS